MKQNRPLVMAAPSSLHSLANMEQECCEVGPGTNREWSMVRNQQRGKCGGTQDLGRGGDDRRPGKLPGSRSQRGLKPLGVGPRSHWSHPRRDSKAKPQIPARLGDRGEGECGQGSWLGKAGEKRMKMLSIGNSTLKWAWVGTKHFKLTSKHKLTFKFPVCQVGIFTLAWRLWLGENSSGQTITSAYFSNLYFK